MCFGCSKEPSHSAGSSEHPQHMLPKLHKKPYKARFIANSSSCTTTELSKLLTSCLTAIKNMLSNIVKKYMRDLVKTYFGPFKFR